MFVRILLILVIILLLYLTYGVFYRDFGTKHFNLVKRYFPNFLVWPKTEKVYIILFKIIILILLCTVIITTIVFFFIKKGNL
jgi:hypothetical protein